MAGLRATTIVVLFTQMVAAVERLAAHRISPAYTCPFEHPLPIPPIAQVRATYTDPSTGIPIDFYEVEVTPFQHQFYPNLGSAQLVGYNGTFPGPTYRVEKGRQTLIRVTNRDQRQMNMHVHGSYTRSPWDGWALDLIDPGYQKDYLMPNNVNARVLWYHDHADDHNAANIYAGLVGMYQIFDPKEDADAGLPSGDDYDVPLILTAHYFTPEGALTDISKERSSTYGDTFMVNGQIQPYLAVEPRKYRFRILNAAVSRVFNLGLRHEDHSVPMTVIGSDGGLRETPVDTYSLITGMADRWEIVIDFADFAGENLTMITKNMWTDARHSEHNEVMRFVVGEQVSDHTGNAPISRVLKVVDQTFTQAQPTVQRTITFDSHHDQAWGIDGRMDDPMERILFRPPLGTVERYTVTSRGEGLGKRDQDPNDKRQIPKNIPTNMGGTGMMVWTHVLHMHLVDMKIVSRRKADPNLSAGRNHVEPYEDGSIKDVAILGSNEVIEVIAKYQPYPGLYMLHCHNLIHEDNGMMATFNVTKLADLGYDELTVGLEDPLDDRFKARPVPAGQVTDLDFVEKKLLPYYASLRAYPDPATVDAVEAKYWETHTVPSADETGMIAATQDTITSGTGSQASVPAPAKPGPPHPKSPPHTNTPPHVNTPPVQGKLGAKTKAQPSANSASKGSPEIEGSSHSSHRGGPFTNGMMMSGEAHEPRPQRWGGRYDRGGRVYRGP